MTSLILLVGDDPPGCPEKVFDAGCQPPDLIVSDVMMPFLSGVDLCEALKGNASTARVPVILMSAVAQTGGSDLDALDALVENILDSQDHSGGETMNLRATTERERTRGGDARDLATLQLRHDQKNSGVSRRGLLRGGGRLRIEYDPARLVPPAGLEKPLTEVVCHLRFQPSGDQQSQGLAPQGERLYQPQPEAPRPIRAELHVSGN
jgi:CheY-like chemotaxis protein